MRVVISNFSAPIQSRLDYQAYWARHEMPPPREQCSSLFEQAVDWGFHLYAPGVYLRDQGVADRVEFWDFTEERRTFYLSNGILKVTFHNEEDVAAYLARFGDPDLFINHGPQGRRVLPMLAGRCFRVHVPALNVDGGNPNQGAECYLVDSEEYLDARSAMYIPVVNTRKICPDGRPTQRDFIYLAACYGGKRHDLLLDAVRGTELTGHLHPVSPTQLDLTGTHITTSALNERDVVELLRTSRIAVYPGDRTSSPASMWECVAAGLPIVVNENIRGGKHLVVPDVTGELSSEAGFRDTMQRVLRNLDRYRAREYFVEQWDTIEVLESYLEFFRRMGWRGH